jgi:hypothetical protein
MTEFVAATKAGLCPEPWDFFRHGNIPKKSEKSKPPAKPMVLISNFSDPTQITH